MLSNEIRERELKRIKDILKIGLKKEFLLSANKNDFNGFENKVKANVCKFKYEPDELAKVILHIVERFGNEVNIFDGRQVENRSIYLETFKYNVSYDSQSEDYRKIDCYRYFVYPDSVNRFLNDIEGKKSNSVLDNNSILVGFDNVEIDGNFINFNNSFNVIFSSLDDYVIIKYLFNNFSVECVRDYEKEVYESELAVNNFMCNSLNVDTSLNNLIISKNTINKNVFDKNKCKTKKLV